MKRSDEIRYALSRHVPDMARGFTIHTNYGDLRIDPGPDAERIANAVRAALERQLKQALRAEAQQPATTNAAGIFDRLTGTAKNEENGNGKRPPEN